MKISYLLHIDWNWIKQRPHFIAEGLNSLHKIKVFYPRSMKTIFTSRKQEPKFVQGIIQLPFSHLKFIRKLNEIIFYWLVKDSVQNSDIIWFTNPKQYSEIKPLIKPGIKLVYDCMDDISEFPHNKNNPLLYKTVIEQEKKLVQESNLIFYSSSYLKEKMNRRYSISNKFKILNNAVDNSIIEKFNRSQFRNKINSKKFYEIAYVGTISEWFDFKILKTSLQRFPEINFILIGPATVEIPSHPRIICKGAIQHDLLPEALDSVDALMMPFLINELILSVNPVKLYEYIATGKPVISCDYEEIDQFKKFIYTYKNEVEFEKFISDLINNKLKTESFPIRKSFLQENTWDNRCKQVNEELKKLY